MAGEDAKLTVPSISSTAVSAVRVILIVGVIGLILFSSSASNASGPVYGVLALLVVVVGLVVLGYQRETYVLEPDGVTISSARVGPWAVLARPSSRFVAFGSLEGVSVRGAPGRQHLSLRVKNAPAVKLYATDGSGRFVEAFRAARPQLFALRASERPAQTEPVTDVSQRFDLETVAYDPTFLRWLYSWGWMFALAVAIPMLLFGSSWVQGVAIAGLVAFVLAIPVSLARIAFATARRRRDTTIRLTADRLSVDHHDPRYAHEAFDVSFDDIKRVEHLADALIVHFKARPRAALMAPMNPDAAESLQECAMALKKLRPDLVQEGKRLRRRR